MKKRLILFKIMPIIFIWLIIIQNIAVYACQGGGTPRQENLGRLLLKNNYSNISCRYLGQPYNFAGNYAHAGIDYPASSGKPVYAPVTGEYKNSSTVSLGEASYIILPNGKRLFILHLKNRILGHRDKGQKIGEINIDHVHAELRVNYQGTYAVGGASCGGTCYLSDIETLTDDPSEVVEDDNIITVYDFWRRADPIYESNQNGINNFDAQFKVRNDSSSTKTIENMAIDIINQNGTRFAMWVKNSQTTLSPGSHYSTGIHYEELWYNGSYAVEARLKVNGEWSTYGRIEFQVLDQDSGGGDPPGGGSGNADITIDEVKVSKAGHNNFHHDFTVTSGDNNHVDIEVDVKNKKNDDTNIDIYYYWDDDKNFSFKDSHLKGTDLNVDLDGDDHVVEHKRNIKIPDEPGNHYFYVYVRAPGDTDKSKSSNHDEYGKVVVLPRPKPDLIVQSPSSNDTTLSPGQTFNFSATVKNQGNGNSPSTTLRYYLSSNSIISTADSLKGTDSVSGLPANGTSFESISLSAPSTPGTYWIGACVDSVNEESNDGNNCSSGVQLIVSNPSHPDLVVQSPSVSKSSLVPGETFIFHATVKNQGNSSSSSTTLTVYRIADIDIPLGPSVTVSGLSPNGISIKDVTVTAPTTTGTYWLGACADAVSGELNTNNNCSSSIQITVINGNSPPNIPTSPIPSNGGHNISVSSFLNIAGGDPNANDTVRYDFYLEANDPTPDNIVCNNSTSTFCNVSNILTYNTQYYWKVIAKDNHGSTTTGPVWSFKTIQHAPAIINNFMSTYMPAIINAASKGRRKPGLSCGTSRVYDCAGNCVESGVANAWIGDSYCDDGTYGMVLNCSAFQNDGGDCN